MAIRHEETRPFPCLHLFFISWDIFVLVQKNGQQFDREKPHTPLPHNNASFYKCCFGMNYYTCVRGERLLGFSESWFFTRKSRSSILLVPSWNLHYVVLKTNWEIFFFAFLSHFKILSIYAKMTKSYWKKENVFLIYESFLKFNFYYK